MKNSGIEWIGEIPNNWEVNLVKNIFDITRGRVIAKTEIEEEFMEGYYPVYSSQTANSGILGYIPSYDFAIDSLTWTTDGAKAGTVFLRKGKYSITNVCGILTLKTSEYSLNYLYYAVGFSAYNSRRADINGYKIMSNEMAAISIPVPDKIEQQKIAEVLDEKCGKIDTLIENEQKQIEKMKEYKQSVITSAVTKGLNKSAPLKDSGIDWIGEIPESWRVCPLKYCVQANMESLSEKEDDNLQVKYIDISSVNNCGEINNLQEFLFKDAPSRARRIVKEGDIIISTVRTYLKAIAKVTAEYSDFICSTGFAVLTPNNMCDKNFLYYTLFSNVFTSKVETYSNGISYPAINCSVLVSLPIILPSMEEQKEIADYLDEKCGKIDEIISIKQRKIEKLQEYKKSLIYEYVTGKKEVV